jgi:hypothetical protein
VSEKTPVPMDCAPSSGRKVILSVQVTDLARLALALDRAVQRWPSVEGNSDEAFALAEFRLELVALIRRRESARHGWRASSVQGRIVGPEGRDPFVALDAARLVRGYFT